MRRMVIGLLLWITTTCSALAGDVVKPLKAMARDGSFDAPFDKYFASSLRDLRLDQRVVIDLDNPFLPAWAPFDRPELWFDSNAARRWSRR